MTAAREAKTHVVGTSVPRVDALDKVTGTTVYGSDVVLPGMLFGKILRSPHAHARIVRVDTSKAEALDGVRAVVTAADTPKLTYGFQSGQNPRLADKMPLEAEKVRFIGDEVAAVAAVDALTAEKALELIEVDYEVLPAVFDPELARQPGAPLIHEGVERNVIDVFDYGEGDVERGMAEADVVVEREYFSQAVAPTAMETHQAVASWDARGRLTMYASTQMPFLLRAHLAAVLGLDEGDVRILKMPMGGGFGGRMEMHSLDPICAVLARKAGRPVKIVYSREEEFLASRFRHPIRMQVRLGAKRDGTMTALDMDMLTDSGAYVSQACGVARVGAVNALTLYRIPDTRVHSEIAYTNNPYGGAFRGYGNTQGNFALESIVDDLAEALGMDAVELRIKNGNQPGQSTYLAQEIESCGYEESLRRGREASGWDSIRGRHERRGRKVRGIGMASVINVGGGARDQGDSDSSGAVVIMQDDGSVTVNTGGQEIGSGGTTVFAQIAAEELGVSIDRVTVHNSDTDLMPWDIGCHAQRNVFCAGNAVRVAAAEARAVLMEEIQRQIGADPSEVEVYEDQVWVGGASVAAIGEIAHKAHFRSGGRYIWGKGFYDPPTVKTDSRGRGQKSGAYSFGAQFAEVEVDLDTGEVDVVKVVAAHDVGRAINPAGVEGQIEGGVVQALGQALTEHLVFDEGHLRNATLTDYRIPTAVDSPIVEPIIVESNDQEGPYGAKGVAEATIVPTLAAVTNAIYDAVGVRIDELPASAERVLLGLQAKAARAGS